MLEIKDLLARFEGILVKEEFKKEAVREIISKIVGFEIKSEELNIKNGTLYLNIKPIYKNEIFLKKERIIKELEKALGKKSPEDIR